MSISLTKVGQTKRASKFIATVVSNKIEDVDNGYGMRTKWIQELKMLDIDNRDEFGREIPRVDALNVFTSSGEPSGEGSGVNLKANAYGALLELEDIGEGDITVGKTFRFAAERIDRGKDKTGKAVYEYACVPVEFFATGYKHPDDKPRPVWQRKPREEDGVSSPAQVAVSIATPMSEDEIDEVLAKMFDGRDSAPDVATLVSNSATKNKKVIADVQSGEALERLVNKGLVTVDDAGTFVAVS